MQIDPLNPLSPRNPSQQIQQESSKMNPEQIKKIKTEQETLKDDLHEYAEGYENVFLPSKGLFYRGDAKGIEYLSVRPFDYTDEDILSTPSFYENGTIYVELLNNVILSKSYLKAKNLVPIDRDTILIWLRSTSFGNEFKVEYECPKCGKGSGDGIKGKGGEMIWHLDELKIPSYDDELYEKISKDGELSIITPAKQVKLRITVPTASVMESLDKKFTLKKDREKIKKDFFASITLLSVVSGIEMEDGKIERDKNRIDQYFKQIRLPITDSRFILENARDLNLRYETAQDFVCKDCKYIEEGVELPIMHRNFFWPKSR